MSAPVTELSCTGFLIQSARAQCFCCAAAHQQSTEPAAVRRLHCLRREHSLMPVKTYMSRRLCNWALGNRVSGCECCSPCSRAAEDVHSSSMPLLQLQKKFLLMGFGLSVCYMSVAT